MSITPSESTIRTVQEAVDLVCTLFNGPERKEPKLSSKEANIWEQPVPARGYKFPFGLWFRGEEAQWEKVDARAEGLSPAVFRPRSGETLEEGSLMYHFQLRTPEHRTTNRTEFDWLALMQHYMLPTRMLDWSENVLVGLYFAAGGRFPGKSGSHPDKDGRLYVLNARRLNAMTSLCPIDRDSIHIPNSIDAVLRANIAFQSRQLRWIERVRQLVSTPDVEDARWLQSELNILEETAPFSWKDEGEPAARPVAEQDEERWRRGVLLRLRLRSPVAIFPHRANQRLVAQQGMFTIHGGRVNNWGGQPLIDGHPSPISLNLLNEESPDSLIRRLDTEAPTSDLTKNVVQCWWSESRRRFGPLLLRITIPKECKPYIIRDLVAIGVHEATMFPELDGQSMYVSEQWWRKQTPSRSTVGNP